VINYFTVTTVEHMRSSGENPALYFHWRLILSDRPICALRLHQDIVIICQQLIISH